MSAARAVNYAVVHTGVALLLGVAVDKLMPDYNEGNSSMELVLETAVQAGMNGFAIAMSSRYLSENDPTAGIMFGWVLSGSQPEFNKRLSALRQQLGQQFNGVAASKTPTPS